MLLLGRYTLAAVLDRRVRTQPCNEMGFRAWGPVPLREDRSPRAVHAGREPSASFYAYGDRSLRRPVTESNALAGHLREPVCPQGSGPKRPVCPPETGPESNNGAQRVFPAHQAYGNRSLIPGIGPRELNLSSADFCTISSRGLQLQCTFGALDIFGFSEAYALDN
uniref:Uncharacterized protein n=1 Tax=Ananas comosus var. bracteatus TaxID=296719 RepID=A0A6V7PXZ1_ANACO|nr:unnamed protein product [Ananas comosus var. bracteatus]